METKALDADIAVVKWSDGELEQTRFGADDTAQKVTELLRKGKDLFVLDLTDVKHADSSGIAVLFSVYLRIAREGGTAALVCPDIGIKEVLALLKMDRIVRVFDTIEEAIEYLRGVEKEE